MNSNEALTSDAQIRRVLHLRLREEHAHEDDTRIIDELGLCRGQVRVDVVVVNGLLHGYEIKSDRDSLSRLEAQTEVYGKVLDRATVVVGDRHLSRAQELVPAWWGVLRARRTTEGIRLQSVRRGRQNPHRDPRSLVELLWLNDAIALLTQRDAVRGVRGKPRRMAWDRVCEQFALDEIAAAVRDQLKARTVPRAPA